MASDDQAYFMWVSGPKGPERQKWAGPPYRADSYWDHKILRRHPISQAVFDSLTLDELEKLYPAPCTSS